MERPRLAGVFGQLLNAVDDAAGEVAAENAVTIDMAVRAQSRSPSFRRASAPVTISEMPGRGIDHEEH